jgi:hypothetical protein
MCQDTECFQIAKLVEKQRMKTLFYKPPAEPHLASLDFQMPKFWNIFCSDKLAHPALDKKGISLEVEIYGFPKRAVECQSICSLSQDTRLAVGMEDGGRSNYNCSTRSIIV